jgi:hypothetical protein
MAKRKRQPEPNAAKQNAFAGAFVVELSYFLALLPAGRVEIEPALSPLGLSALDLPRTVHFMCCDVLAAISGAYSRWNLDVCLRNGFHPS